MSTPEPSFADWIDRARKAAGPSERVSCLRSAQVLATSDSDWRSLAAQYWELSKDRDSALRCLNKAIGIAPEQVWCFAELAALKRDAFLDKEGAAAVLAQSEANLESSGKTPAYRWRQLAGHYKAIALDDAGARRCLDTGRSRARNASDLCDIATGYGTLLDEVDVGRELLKRAAEMLVGDPARTDKVEVRTFWSVANAYKALGDPEGARRSIEQGLALASDVAGCETLAHAWSSHKTDDLSITLRCLDKGEGLAASAEDWLKLAEAYHQHAGDPKACRRCLDLVAELGNDDLLRRAARGFLHWLGDEDAANRISPRGRRPEDLGPKRRSLPGWDADPSALLRLLLAASTLKILEAIASADYGFGYEDNLAALKDMQQTGLVPVPLEWQLHEVFALCRWGEGERVEHVERALVCMMLCLDYVAGDCTEDITATLAPLLESCLELGTDAVGALVGLLVWLIEADPMGPTDEEKEEDDYDEADYEGADLLAARFALVLAQASVDPSDSRLPALVTSLIEKESAFGADHYMVEDERGWIFRVLCSMRDEMWKDTASRVLSAASGPGREELERLRALVDPKESF